jgi:hypothetical protein
VVNAILSGMDGAYPSILALPDGQAMIDKGLKTLGTSDEAVVNEIYSELINYLLENTVNIPVSTRRKWCSTAATAFRMWRLAARPTCLMSLG